LIEKNLHEGRSELTRANSKSHGCARGVCIPINLGMCLCERNESSEHSLKRESMHNSQVLKGSKKQILFLGTGIVGQGFSNQANKQSCRNM
jgi:hypothetical protein